MKNLLFIAVVSLLALTGCTSKNAKTIENIKFGIETETTASVMYAAFAQKAIAEGHDTIARLFEAASKAEAIHASNHAAVLKTFKATMGEFTPEFEVKTTAENLQTAIDRETHEVNSMYPMFLKDAKSKKIKIATKKSLTWALETEKKHVQLFTKALEAFNANAENMLPFEYFVCPVCGETYNNTDVKENCVLCMTSNLLYIVI